MIFFVESGNFRFGFFTMIFQGFNIYFSGGEGGDRDYLLSSFLGEDVKNSRSRVRR